MAADESITTLARVKAYLGITVSTYDDVLTTLLNTATQWVKDQCNRPLGWAQTTYIDKMNPNDSDTCVLKYDPVDTTDEFTLRIVRNGTTVYTFNAAEYEVTTGGVVRLLGNGWSSWQSWAGWGGTGTYSNAYVFDRPSFGVGLTSLEAMYVGGYATIPETLQQAVVEVTKGLFQQRIEDGTIEMEKLGDYVYKRTAGGLRAVFDDVKEMYLNRYMRGATLS